MRCPSSSYKVRVEYTTAPSRPQLPAGILEPPPPAFTRRVVRQRHRGGRPQRNCLFYSTLIDVQRTRRSGAARGLVLMLSPGSMRLAAHTVLSTWSSVFSFARASGREQLRQAGCVDLAVTVEVSRAALARSPTGQQLREVGGESRPRSNCAFSGRRRAEPPPPARPGAQSTSAPRDR